MSTEKSFETEELAATLESLKRRLLWRLETLDLRAAEAALELDDAEPVDADS